ncbi:hypothetical protein FRC00_012882 [Tulasnella sp. 408]|nr:hypothetical protein FRC00_012882 [Tulasnella sp. 408]
MSTKYEPLDQLQAFPHVDPAVNGTVLPGKEATLEKKEEEEEGKPVWVVHVEARLKPSSSALADFIKKSVKDFLAGDANNLFLPSTITGWTRSPPLANNIDLLRITESNSVPFSQAELEIHVYQPTDGDAFEEFATSKTDGEEVVAASVCELPCRNWDGLWDT